MADKPTQSYATEPVVADKKNPEPRDATQTTPTPSGDPTLRGPDSPEFRVAEGVSPERIASAIPEPARTQWLEDDDLPDPPKLGKPVVTSDR